jgi:hypothetical protein
MKKSITPKKLVLTHDTLKVLEASSLKQVVGGITSPCPIGTAKVDCG